MENEWNTKAMTFMSVKPEFTRIFEFFFSLYIQY